MQLKNLKNKRKPLNQRNKSSNQIVNKTRQQNKREERKQRNK